MRTHHKPLSAKRERFCREYLVDLNATQAAVRSGYSPRTAEQQGPRLLIYPEVKARLAELGLKVAETLGLKAEDVLRETMAVAFSDIHDLVTWGPTGVRLRDSETLDPGLTRCVAEVSVTRNGGTARIKLHSKSDALDKLFRYLALYREKPDGEQDKPRQVLVVGGQRIVF